jgi:hypothetical protein
MKWKIIIIGVIFLSLGLTFVFRQTGEVVVTKNIEADTEKAIRRATAEMRQAKAELDKSKEELFAIIREAKADIAAQRMSPNVETDWYRYDAFVDQKRPIVTWAGKPQEKMIEVGLRHDGLIIWRP